MADVRSVVSQWLQEFQAPCLLQRRVTISRDMRVTYVRASEGPSVILKVPSEMKRERASAFST